MLNGHNLKFLLNVVDLILYFISQNEVLVIRLLDI